MAGGRVDEVPDNVFRVSSRLNSTWGGNLTDMVRSRRCLEVIEADGLVDRAAVLGKRLLDDLGAVAGIDNVRGRGLFVAFDLPSPAERDETVARLHRDGVLLLPGGERSIRLRPALTISEDELELAVARDPEGGNRHERACERITVTAPERSADRAQRGRAMSFIGGKWRDDAPGGG